MAIKYNPYNWEIRPMEKHYDPEIILKIDMDTNEIIKTIEKELEEVFRKDIKVEIIER